MPKRVLCVGQCAPDHAAIRRLVEGHFEAKVTQAHHLQDTLTHLRDGEFHLVLINRKLDRDYSDGAEILKAITADPELSDVPVMLITNYPDHQEIAIAAGGVRGFGKNGLHLDETRALLADHLE